MPPCPIPAKRHPSPRASVRGGNHHSLAIFGEGRGYTFRRTVFRLGRIIGQKGPGVVNLIPLIDKAVRVDLREVFLKIPAQTCITKDNAPISIDFLIYWKVVDPQLSVIQVNFAGAAQGIATTGLRAVIGDMSLKEVLAKRDQISQVLRAKLDETTERLGVKVNTVEIREITLPNDVQEAMTNRSKRCPQGHVSQTLDWTYCPHDGQPLA